MYLLPTSNRDIRGFSQLFLVQLLCLSFFGFTELLADTKDVKVYQTIKLIDSNLQIDGLLNDAAWDNVAWHGEFSVWEPNNGASPHNDTRFKLLYDDDFLYVGIQAFDSDPDSLIKRMTARDGFDGDRLSIVLDSYYDKITAFSFTVSVSGVQGDEFVTNNGNNWDESWNAIWYSNTSVNEDGWFAEFKIPLSQIRFGNKSQQTWGLQIFRHDFRNGEISMWQPISIDAPGFIDRFGLVKGIEDLKPKRQVEIMPYLVTKSERVPESSGNPFISNSPEALYGLDAKIGLTNDMILDLTINPDFGQVEADPSVVNLSNFENFFREQRPFFVEGSNITNFQLARSDFGGPFWQDNLFYSRRIGRSPSHSPNLQNGAFSDSPTATRILSAAKITGKNKNGLSVGFINSTTQREEARIANVDGSRRRETVEPMTNYLVGRVAKEYNQGDHSIGAMFTATNRFNDEDHLDFLHSEAYTGGVDGFTTWNERSWRVAANVHFSHVGGSSEALMRTQQNGVHNFQRVGASHLNVDSTRTSMSGLGGTLTVGRYGNGNWSFQTGTNFRSPGLDVNDLGFQREADRIYQFTWTGYRILQPKGIFNSFRLNLNQWNEWDFSGLHANQGVNVNMHMQFTNFYRISMGSNYNRINISTNALRGGSAFQFPSSANLWIYASTDDRKNLVFGINPYISRPTEGSDYGFEGYGIDFELSYQPSARLRLFLQPGYGYDKNGFQWINNVQDENGETQYVLGRVEQQTFRSSIRVNYIISPRMNVQLWAQPFIAKGSYDNFKLVSSNPLSSELENRFIPINPIYEDESNSYLLSAENSNQASLQFGNPDFHFGQFRSNLVFRWEFQPGSNLYLVWSQDRTGSLDQTAFADRITRNLSGLEGRHVFLLKVSYRFLRS